MKKRSTLGVTLTGGLEEEVTPWAGAALLVELYRKAGIGAAVEQSLSNLPNLKCPASGVYSNWVIFYFLYRA